MAEVKIRKQDIQEAKQPDVVLQGATSVFDWLVEHRTAALGAVIGLVVVVGGISVAQNVRQGKATEVGGQLSQALELQTRPVAPPKAAEGEKKDDQAKDESFATKKDRETAVDTALVAVTKDHEGTPTARSASVMLAAQRYDEGKYDEAISLADGYVSQGGDLKQFALETLGNAYAAKNDTAKAEDAYKKLSDAGAPALALYLQGTLAEKSGKKDDARKLYEKVVADYEKDNANVAKDAHARLDLLGLPEAGTGALEAPAAPAEPSNDKAPKKPAKKAVTTQVKTGGK